MSSTPLSIFLLSSTWDLTEKLVKEDLAELHMLLAAGCQGCFTWAKLILWNKRTVTSVVQTFYMHKDFFICLLLEKKLESSRSIQECSQVGPWMSSVLKILSFLTIQLRKFLCLVDCLKRRRKSHVWTICFFFDIGIKVL